MKNWLRGFLISIGFLSIIAFVIFILFWGAFNPYPWGWILVLLCIPLAFWIDKA